MFFTCFPWWLGLKPEDSPNKWMLLRCLEDHQIIIPRKKTHFQRHSKMVKEKLGSSYLWIFSWGFSWWFFWAFNWFNDERLRIWWHVFFLMKLETSRNEFFFGWFKTYDSIFVVNEPWHLPAILNIRVAGFWPGRQLRAGFLANSQNIRPA